MRSFLSLSLVFLIAFCASPTLAQTQSSTETPTEPEPPKEINGKSYEDWVKDVKSKDPSIRLIAIQTIPLFGKRAVGAARYFSEQLAKREKDIAVRANLALALGKVYVPEKDVPIVVSALASRLKASRVSGQILRQEKQTIVRFYAAQSLARFEEKARSALPELKIAAFDRNAWEIRRAGINGLGAIAKDAPAKAFDVILEALLYSLKKDWCGQVRLSATRALTEICKKGTKQQKAKVLTAFQARLADKEVTVAVWAHAGIILVDGPNKDYLDPLANFLKSKQLTARTHAILALAMLGKDAATKVPDLLQMLTDKQPLVVSMACWAIGEIGLQVRLDREVSQALRRLAVNKDLNIVIRQEIIGAIKKVEEQKKVGKEDKEMVTKLWMEHFKKPPLEAKKKVVALGGKTLDVWKKEILDRDPSVRENAIRTSAYFQSDSRDVVPNIIKIFREDRDVSVRVNAARVLAGIEVAEKDVDDVISVLKLGLEKDRQAIVRFYAATALGRYQDEARSAIPQLINACGDGGSWEIRQAALTSLAAVAREKDRAPEKRVIDAFERGLRDPSAQVRLAATMSIGALALKPQTPVGIRLARALQAVALKEKNAMVAIWAYVGLMAMDKVKPEHLKSLAKFLKHRKPTARSSAARAFGVMGKHSKPHIDDLVVLLKDKAPNVVGTACWALGNIGKQAHPGEEAVKAIKKIADDKENHKSLRKIAEQALEDIEGKKKAK